jgi:hypothetical protein
MMLEGLANKFDAHVFCRSFDLAHSRFDGRTVEVGEFLFSDFANLCGRDLADFVGVRFRRSFFDFCCFLQKLCDRSGLENEGVRAVVEEGDDDRNHFAKTVLRCRVHFLTELSDVHTVLTERRTKRWRWVGFSADDLNFDQGFDFFCHRLGVKEFDLRFTPA